MGVVSRAGEAVRVLNWESRREALSQGGEVGGHLGCSPGWGDPHPSTPHHGLLRGAKPGTGLHKASSLRASLAHARLTDGSSRVEPLCGGSLGSHSADHASSTIPFVY